MRHISNLFILAAVAFGLAGCASDNTGTSGDLSGKGSVAMQLQNGAGDQVAATIILTRQGADPGDPTASTTITTALDDARLAIEVILLPGTYSLSMSGVSCNPAATTTPTPGSAGAGGAGSEDSSTYNGCTFIGFNIGSDTYAPTDTFLVSENATTLLTLLFNFQYTGTEDEIVVFGVGSANLSLGVPALEELCGTAPACDEGQVCATVSRSNDDPVTGCYVPCTSVDGCVQDNSLCLAVAAQSADDIGDHNAAAPQPVLIGSENDLDAILHVCVPAASVPPSGEGGAGGSGS